MSLSFTGSPSFPRRQSDARARVIAAVTDMFADPDAFRRTPHSELGGRSPDECLNDGDVAAVRHLLDRILYAPIA